MQDSSIIGLKFGKLSIVDFVNTDKYQKQKVRCICECGTNDVIVQLGNLKTKHTTSCGCARKAAIIKRCLKHGHKTRSYVSRAYRSWLGMIHRCHNADSMDYALYGDRGITVCEHWRRSYENFLADMGEPPLKHSIDRIDNNGNYCPENCRWADASTQSKNRRKFCHNGGYKKAWKLKKQNIGLRQPLLWGSVQ